MQGASAGFRDELMAWLVVGALVAIIRLAEKVYSEFSENHPTLWGYIALGLGTASFVFAVRVSAVAAALKEQWSDPLGSLIALVLGGAVMLVAVVVGILFFISGISRLGR